MTPFSNLLDRLSYEPRRTEKLRHIVRYLREAPDPDRGYALAALCGALDIPAVNSGEEESEEEAEARRRAEEEVVE